VCVCVCARLNMCERAGEGSGREAAGERSECMPGRGDILFESRVFWLFVSLSLLARLPLPLSPFSPPLSSCAEHTVWLEGAEAGAVGG
jgi:hypothetical protein